MTDPDSRQAGRAGTPAGEMLVVGSVALDTVETPFGRAEEVLGGSAVYFGAAASLFGPVRVVGVVGGDYPVDRLDFLRERGVDLSGLEVMDGRSFRWVARYDYDLESRETLRTELGVFGDFEPVIPEEFRRTPWIFLGNIHPSLQLRVLDQMESPRLVACDTMNYWIDRDRDLLLELLERVDMVVINDAESRALANHHNLARAVRWIQERGPRHVVVKKGEHGALLFARDFFFAPGYPLEEIFDPTGAGDAFAGGLLGHLSYTGDPGEEALRRAVVYGCAMGSFACEGFGPDRFRDLARRDVAARVRAFREMTRFVQPGPLPESPGSRAVTVGSAGEERRSGVRPREGESGPQNGDDS